MNELLKYLLMMGQQANHQLQKAYGKSPTNPLPHRLHLLLNEFTYHLAESIHKFHDKHTLEEHLKILYRDGIMIGEMHTMLNRTESKTSLNTEIAAIQEGLSQLVRYVTVDFGYENTKYIVPSYFQQLSGLWGTAVSVE